MKRKRDSGVDFEGEEDAAVADFSSPHGPAMIGPTPQRDGIVLGLFDLLPAGTPSRSRVVFAEVTPNDLQTPSRKVGKADSEASLESRMRRDKTPVSVGKRFLLDTFVTPKKRKLNEEGTPTSLFKGFSTPAFLRRSTALDIIDEDNEPTPRPAPWNRRGFGRSLSSVIQSMKQQEEDRLEAEEDRLDDEADIMREMEMEAEGIFVPKRAKIPAVLVEDSQAPMPLGPDRGIGSDDEDDEENAADGLDRNGKPRKVWKKRGMKRQTRRSIRESALQTIDSYRLMHIQYDPTLQNQSPSNLSRHKRIPTPRLALPKPSKTRTIYRPATKILRMNQSTPVTHLTRRKRGRRKTRKPRLPLWSRLSLKRRQQDR
jgi:hypothetical protein